MASFSEGRRSFRLKRESPIFSLIESVGILSIYMHVRGKIFVLFLFNYLYNILRGLHFKLKASLTNSPLSNTKIKHKIQIFTKSNDKDENLKRL